MHAGIVLLRTAGFNSDLKASFDLAETTTIACLRVSIDRAGSILLALTADPEIERKKGDVVIPKFWENGGGFGQWKLAFVFPRSCSADINYDIFSLPRTKAG